WKGNVRELRNTIESMVVQDGDGVLELDDLEEGSALRQISPDNHAAGPANLVGRPLTEVERYFIERTLEMTQGNREEAARMLGIGERTLYRVIQEWKLHDRIKEALSEVNGDIEAAAKRLGVKATVLQRKIKKWGLPANSSEE